MLCMYCAKNGATKKLTTPYNSKSFVYVHNNCWSGIQKLVPNLIEVK